MRQPELIVWDFDGVLNANIRATATGGRMLWAERMQEDLGLDPASLAAHLSRSGLMRDVMRGRHDIHDLLTDWLRAQDAPLDADALLAYWFDRNALPDAQVLGWLKAHPARHVIGTNNEARRASYIEHQMGFGQHVEHIFASGRMGVAKPDPGFFATVERWARLTPPQILLIDDAPANIAAARARGWQAFLFNDDTRASLPDRLGL